MVMRSPISTYSRLYRPAASGFTLLEILIATAVSAIVLLVVQGVFFSALRLRHATDRRIDEDRPLQRTLDVIAADLRGLCVTGGTLTGEFQTDSDFGLFISSSEGTPIGPTFTTTTGRIDARTSFAEVQRVNYRLLSDANASESYTLLRVVDRNLLTTTYGDPLEEVLLHHVSGAGFEYFDGTYWTDSWDSSTSSSVPTAVRFWVQVIPDDGAYGPIGVDSNATPTEIVVPIFVSPSSTATEAAST